MTQEQGGQSEPYRSPTEEHRRNKPHRILERNVKSVEALVQSLGGGLGFFGFIVAFYNIGSGSLILIAAALIGSLSAYYRVCYNHYKYLVWGTHPVTAITVTNSFLLLGAAWLWLAPMVFTPKIPPPAKPFVITPGWSAFSATGQSGLTNLISVGAFRGFPSIKRINLLEQITVANNRPIPTTIIGLKAFNAESEQNPEWTVLCEVPLRKQRLFFLTRGLKIASELATDDALENRLSNHTIAAHDSVSGWIAFECQGATCGHREKIIITEANGEVSETEPFPLSSNSANLEDWIPDPTGQTEDLTSMSIAPTSCNSPETIGLMWLGPDNVDPPITHNTPNGPTCPGPWLVCNKR